MKPTRQVVVMECVDEQPVDAWPAIPFEIRMRHFLKAMLRAHKIRCRRLCDGAKVEIVLKDQPNPESV